MLTDFFNRLMGTTPHPDRSIDHRLALAALLVRCARIDGVYDVAEQARIDSILARRNGLNTDQAAALRTGGEELERDTGDTVHITKAIKDGVPLDERGAIVEALWSVVLADDDRDHTENAFLRLVSRLLGISDVDSAHARQRAQAAGD